MPTVVSITSRAAAPTPMAIHHAPRVFTASFQEQLAAFNAAERELRSLGFHVVWSRMDGPVFRAHIRRDAAVSVAPLLDRMGPRNFRKEEGCMVVSGMFEGILLSWAEPI